MRRKRQCALHRIKAPGRPFIRLEKKQRRRWKRFRTRIGAEIPAEQKRFYAVKLFERDDKITEQMSNVPDVENIILDTERVMEDDAESIITNERYIYIASVIKKCYVKRTERSLRCRIRSTVL